MNKLILFFIAALMLGCSKETPTEQPPPTGTIDFANLIGRWRYEEVQISPNTPIMQEVQQIQGRVIEFRGDSTFSLPVPGFPEEGIFRMRGARRIWFDRGSLDEQIKEIDELTPTLMRGRILVMSDDGGSWQQVGTAEVRLARVR
jgi:hypothetical protein